MDFSDLKNIFNANCFPIDQSALKEVGEGNVVVQSVPIDGGGVDSCCVIRIDPNFKDPFPYFKEDEPYHLKRICDYFVFVSANTKIYVLLVELKSGTGTALQQLENSECFWNFIQKSAERNGVDVSNIERTIKVKLHQPQKAGTKIEVPRYDTKTNCVIYHWSSCRLNRILQLVH